MTKFKFLATLQDRLAGLPREEVDERLRFYCEMIEDRMEEGLSEEEAVAAVGSVDEIVSQIAESFPLPNAEAHETTQNGSAKSGRFSYWYWARPYGFLCCWQHCPWCFRCMSPFGL